jgi:diaminopimelate decarboxylase
LGRGFHSKAVTAGAAASDGTPIKFGITEDKIFSAFQKATDLGFIPVCLHQHLGSGWTKTDFEIIKKAVSKMVDTAKKLQDKGFPLDFINFGGGFGPRYSESGEAFPIPEYIHFINEKIKQSSLVLKALAVEPGKYLAADAGVFLMRVEYIKRNYGHLFACVNAGTFNSVPRPAIYSTAFHPIINCSRISTTELESQTIAGNLCESGDVFGINIKLPVPEEGDLLGMLLTGAYCRSMASRYNARDIPQEIVL